MFKGSIFVYFGMYIVGFAIMMVEVIKTYKSYGITRSRAVMHTLYTYVAGVAGAMIMGSVFMYISQRVGEPSVSIVAIFGAVIFTPLFLLILFLLERTDWRSNLDLLTPGIFTILALSKVGCTCAGCCAGFVWEHGIYNPIVEEHVFLIQPLEALTTSVIVAITFLFRYKSKRYVKGSLYPFASILYCATRFFFEFGRYYESERMKHLFLGLTLWQLCCIGVIIASVLTLWYLQSRHKKETAEMEAASVE